MGVLLHTPVMMSITISHFSIVFSKFNVIYYFFCFIIIYFIFKINQSSISNLENRINCYIFPERAQKTIRAQNRFKNQFSSRLEQKNLELQQLMNFAEFSDLFSLEANVFDDIASLL